MASLTRRTTAPLWKTRCNVMRCCYNWFPLSCNKLKIIILCLFFAKTVFAWKYLQHIERNSIHLIHLRHPCICWSSFYWISFSQSSTSVYILLIFPLDFFFAIFDIEGSKAWLPWKIRERNVSEIFIEKQNKIILTNNNIIMYTCMHTKHKMNENKKTKQNCRKKTK